jgi:hypothetical protein
MLASMMLSLGRSTFKALFPQFPLRTYLNPWYIFFENITMDFGPWEIRRSAS